MGKIFEFNPVKGYIDQVSGAVGVNTNGEIVRSEKGLAWRNAPGGYIDTGVVVSEQVFSAVVNFRSYPESFAGSYSCLISSLDANDDGWQVHVDNTSGRLYFTVNDVDCDPVGIGTIDPGDSLWHQAIASWNGSTAYLYLDGGLQRSKDGTTTVDVVSSMYLGRNRYADTQNIDGDISLVQVYDHVLTSEERALLYRDFLRASPISKTIR